MNINPARAIEREFSTYFKGCTGSTKQYRMSELPQAEQDRIRKRAKELHPSSFPYCALRHAYETLTADADPVVNYDFGGEYFTGAGTHFHTVVQDYLGRGGQMLGNYKCQKCSTLHELTTYPEKCKTRGCKSQDFLYEEVGGVWGKRIHWHMDGVFRDKKGRHWVIDYKTSSTTAIWDHKKTGVKFPYNTNKVQIESYIPLAEDAYSIKISGWLLMYCSRDFPVYNFTPVARAINSERKDEIRERLERDDRLFGVVLKLKDNPELLPKVVKGKLCSDRDFYDKEVHSAYDACPLADHCFSSKKRDKVMTNAFRGIPIVVKD